MKTLITGAYLAVVALLFPAETTADPDPDPAMGHICGATAPPPDVATGPAVHILEGYGSGGFMVRTANPQAQAFFNNGMQLAHAFAHKPSVAAFREAERLDPACAMCAWGEAWARGPTINYTVDEKTQAELWTLADRAARLSEGGPRVEREFAAALQARYRKGGGKGPGDYAFAHAMDDLARAHPDDNEIAVVAADAWMIPASNKETRENLPRALELISGALARKPDDTAAIHFYIHATEMSGFGGQAEAYADKLRSLAPASSHLSHMPSHTFYIVGRYQDALRANLDAMKLDFEDAKVRAPNGDPWLMSYHSHNVQFAIGAAMMSGDGAAALAQARATLDHAAAAKTLGLLDQLVLGTAYFAEGRHGAPEDVMALSEPTPDRLIARTMWRYARGEAQARLGDAAGVRRELAMVAISPEELRAADSFRPQVKGMVEVARLVLTGRAARLEGATADAARAFAAAAEIQDRTLGRLSDPPGWWYPVRRSYAAALLMQGKTDEAASEARRTLKSWPADPLTLALLAQAEKKLGEGEAADQHLAQARVGWHGRGQLEAAAFAATA